LELTLTSTIGSYVTIERYACQPGDVFLVGGYAKTDGSADAQIYLFGFNAAGSLIQIGGPDFGTSASWTYMQSVFTVAANVVYFEVAVRLTGTAGQKAYFDNIYCFKLVDLASGVIPRGSISPTLNNG